MKRHVDRAGKWLAAAMVVSLVGCVGVDRQQGVLAYERGDYAEARTRFTRVVQAHPGDWKANYHLGLMALSEGNADDARVYLEQAYAVRADGPPTHPQTPEVVDALAEAIYLQGDYIQLYGFCSEAARQYGTVRDHVRTGKYLMLTGDPDSALMAFDKARRLAPAGDASAHVALADLFEQVGDEDRAVLELRRAYGVNPRAEGVADRLRGYGIVPGPTVGLPAGGR